jgi:hypothetical protein
MSTTMMTQANAVPTAADLNNMFPELSGFVDLAQDDLMAGAGGLNSYNFFMAAAAAAIGVATLVTLPVSGPIVAAGVIGMSCCGAAMSQATFGW